jgi:hydroxymethylpyrimidine/phosphomethylpyrimidine kinase
MQLLRSCGFNDLEEKASILLDGKNVTKIFGASIRAGFASAAWSGLTGEMAPEAGGKSLALSFPYLFPYRGPMAFPLDSRYMVETPPVVLTIAGFDPSSGAGITADIKTIAANGCYGIAGITALTVQSSSGVKLVVPADASLLRETLEELAADIEISAVHVGMLGSGQIATCVADFLAESKLPYVVLDPVLKSSSGASLLDESGMGVLKKRLLPLATVVTPNLDEATVLTGIEVLDLHGMKRAAQRLHEMGSGAVVVTGGHLEQAVDLLSIDRLNTKGEQKVFRAERVASKHTHGTGCAFSTAIACHLAWGRPLSTAVLLAKAYVTSAIRYGYAVGKGAGPVNHMFQKRNLGNGEE